MRIVTTFIYFSGCELSRKRVTYSILFLIEVCLCRHKTVLFKMRKIQI
jgi:hypothetical protein